MLTRTRNLICRLCLWGLPLCPLLPASGQVVNTVGPFIVSPSRPKDTRGETVYETQGPDQMDQTVVAGTLIQPVPIKLPNPKFPKSLKKSHADADVTVEGVIARDGDLIDASVSSTSGNDAQRPLSMVW